MPRVVITKEGSEVENSAKICPVSCFHKDPETGRMVIDPDECIDCGVCETEAPKGSILMDSDASAEDRKFNADKSKEWPGA